jgi:hypothetical protein
VAAAENIVITTDSVPYELAPAVLAVFEEAGPAGLESSSRSSPIADAVCEMFTVARSSPAARGSRPASVLPDYNIEWAVTYLVKLGCLLKAGHMRFITEEGRELLKMPLDDIHRLVKAIKNAENNKNLQLEIKDQLTADDLEDSDNHDDRVRSFRSTVIRIGASPFRSALMKAYQGRCAISGSEVVQVLQAAHIIRYLGPHTDRVNNGLLLRVDLHQLFDKNLIGIDPSNRKVCVSGGLVGTEYEELANRQLAEPVASQQRPGKQRLEKRWKKFLEAENLVLPWMPLEGLANQRLARHYAYLISCHPCRQRRIVQASLSRSSLARIRPSRCLPRT